MRNTLEISGILLAVLLSAMAFHAWLTEHDDRLHLESTLTTQKQALDAANLREQDRAATLKDTLAQIESLKRQTQTPAQILSALPKFLALPQPIALALPQSAADPTQRDTAQKGTQQEGTPQQGTARPENSPCVAKKGCTQSPPPSSATTAANAAPGLESPAATPSNQQELPRRPHRANSRRRSKTTLRFRPGLPLLPSPTSRSQAGLHGQRREVSRRHQRT
jgi:hypothetical protein